MEPPKVEYKDLVGTATFIGSAVLMVWGIIGSILPAILLTASVSYLFQRWNQRDVRKYEKRRILVMEVLGPIYGELLRITRDFESTEGSYRTYLYREGLWGQIRFSYIFYLIPPELRQKLDSFFEAYDGLSMSGSIARRVEDIAKRVAGDLLKEDAQLQDTPSFGVGTPRASTALDLNGSIFWQVEPSTQLRDTFPEGPIEIRYVQIRAFPRTATGLAAVKEWMLRDKEASDYAETFLQRCREESEKDSELIKTRKVWRDTHNTAVQLYDEVRREIEQWAE